MRQRLQDCQELAREEGFVGRQGEYAPHWSGTLACIPELTGGHQEGVAVNLKCHLGSY